MTKHDIRWIRMGLAVALGFGVIWVLATVGVWAFHVLGRIVRLLLIAGIIGYLLGPLTRRLEARGLHRTTAATVVFGGLMLLLITLLATLMPSLVDQIGDIRAGETLERLQGLVEKMEGELTVFLAALDLPPPDLKTPLTAFLSDQVEAFFSRVPGLLAVSLDVVLVPFLLFFFLKDGPMFRQRLIATVPNRFFEFTLNLLHKIDLQLGNFLRGQLVAALVVGLLSTVALWVLGVDYFLVIGPVAGLANMIPYLGPFLGAVMAVAASFLGGGSMAKAGVILLAFAGIQLIDNTVVSPLVLSRNVALHPAVILLVVILGGELFGFWGLLLAVPTAAAVKVAFRETTQMIHRYRWSG